MGSISLSGFLVWTSKDSLDAFIVSTQTSVNGKVKIRLYKGNATVIGRMSKTIHFTGKIWQLTAR